MDAKRVFVKPEQGIQFSYKNSAGAVIHDFYQPDISQRMFNNLASAYAEYSTKSKYYKSYAEVCKYAAEIVSSLVDKAASVAKDRGVKIGKEMWLKHKYNHLMRGRIEAIGILYDMHTLVVNSDFYVRLRLVRKDGSDSEFIGYTSNYGLCSLKNNGSVIAPQQGSLLECR